MAVTGNAQTALKRSHSLPNLGPCGSSSDEVLKQQQAFLQWFKKQSDSGDQGKSPKLKQDLGEDNNNKEMNSLTGKKERRRKRTKRRMNRTPKRGIL